MARDGYIVMSIVFYIAGLIYMILPEISPMTICISSGIALIAYGIIKIIGYCSNDLYCLAFQYDLACGIFLIVLGVIMLCSSTKLIPYLSVGLGALVLSCAHVKKAWHISPVISNDLDMRPKRSLYGLSFVGSQKQ